MGAADRHRRRTVCSAASSSWPPTLPARSAHPRRAPLAALGVLGAGGTRSAVHVRATRLHRRRTRCPRRSHRHPLLTDHSTDQTEPPDRRTTRRTLSHPSLIGPPNPDHGRAITRARAPAAPEPRGARASGLAVIAGGGIVPTPLLAELIRLGARRAPGPNAARVVHRTALPTVGEVGAFRAQPRPDLLLPGLRPPRRTLRPRPQHPARRRRADPSRQHQVFYAENITCSRLSGPAPPDGPTNSWPTGPSCGSVPPGTATPDHRAADCTSHTGTPTHRYRRAPSHHQRAPALPKRGLTMPTRKNSRAQQTAQRLHAERQRNQRAIDANPTPF